MMNTGPKSYEVSTHMSAEEELERPMEGTQQGEGIRVVSSPAASILGVVLIFGSFYWAFWYLAGFGQRYAQEVQPW